MRRPRALAAALVVLLAIPAGSAQAAAQPFYQHYERGLALAERGEWAAALEELAAAAELEPRPRERIRTYGNRYLFGYDPHFHQARCLVELGRWAAAREQLAEARAGGVTPAAEIDALVNRSAAGERVSREASGPATSSAGAGEPAAGAPAEARRSARLAVTTRPAGAEVLIDGRRIGRTPLAPVPVDAGRHRVRLTAEGFAAWEQIVEAVADETLRLDVALRPPTGETPASSAERDAGSAPAVGRAPAGSGGPGSVEGSRGPAATGAGAESGAVQPGLDPAGAAGGGALGPPGARPADDGAAVDTGRRVGGDRSAGEAGGGEAASEGQPSTATAATAATAGRSRWLQIALTVALALAAVLLIVLLGRRRRAGRDRTSVSGALAGGQRFGGYRVLGELGRGGMAVTYRARRRSDGLEVALKVPRDSPDPTYVERFLREGKLGETLHHPGIVRIFEAAGDHGLPFLAMELIPGRTLRAELDAAPGGLPERRALEIARAIAEALDYAHGKSVVHRDLKPENIMLLPDGGLKVMDFGVARVDGQPGLTTSQVFFGSPLYAAPELIEPRTIDHRADLYSLGILLYEMLEGAPPFVHESVFKLLEMHQRGRLPDPAALPRPLSPALWAIVARLCEKHPKRRYGSAQELLVDLDRLLFTEAPPSSSAAASRRVAGDLPR